MRNEAIVVACLFVGCGLFFDDEPQGRRMPPPGAAGSQTTVADLGPPAMPPLPEALPMVGPDGVDEWGYPHALPDKIGFRQLLIAGRIDELEGYLAEMEAAAAADHRRERWPEVAYGSFRNADPKLRAALDRWVAESPDSHAPWLARGLHINALAWEVRGVRSADKVGDAQMEEFQRLEARAEEDLRKALDFAPKHPSLNTSLLTIGRSLGKPVAELRERRDAALEGCRRCYLPHRDYMLALLPRWGGSYEQMQAEVERLRPRFEEDPKLKVLEGLIAWDQCNAEASAETKKQCDTAVAIARDTRYLHQRAEYFMATKEWDAALADLDALLAFWPQYQEGVRDRAQVHFELQNQEKALIDLLLLRQLDPGDGKTAKRVAEILDWLPGYVHKLNNEGRAGEAKRLMEIGAKLDPDNQQLLNAGGHVDAKLGIDELVAAAKANPDDFDKIRAADYALAAKRRYAEVVELWDDYLSRHPQDGKAYLERAGAHHHLQQEPQAIADLEKSCDLRVVDACRLLERMGR